MNLCSCKQMTSCCVASAEAITSGILPSFCSVCTLKVAMRTSFFLFNSVALELDSLDDVVVLISVADFSTAT